MRRRGQFGTRGLGGAPVAPGTAPPTSTAISATLAPAANPCAHVAPVPAVAENADLAAILNSLASVSAQVSSLARQVAEIVGAGAGTSGGGLALLRQPEPCHGLMDAAAEPAGIETQSLTLTTDELADLLGVDRRTIQRMRAANEGPKPIRVRGAVRYRRRDVERWLEGKRR